MHLSAFKTEWLKSKANGLYQRAKGLFDQVFIDKLAEAVASRVLATAPPPKGLLSLADAAEYLGRSQKAIEHLIQRGTIPVTKLDGKRQVDRAALDKLIADSTYFEV